MLKRYLQCMCPKHRDSMAFKHLVCKVCGKVSCDHDTNYRAYLCDYMRGKAYRHWRQRSRVA